MREIFWSWIISFKDLTLDWIGFDWVGLGWVGKSGFYSKVKDWTLNSGFFDFFVVRFKNCHVDLIIIEVDVETMLVCHYTSIGIRLY